MYMEQKSIEFMTVDGLVLVGFLSIFGYVAISSFENETCGIWQPSEVLAVNELHRQIFYKCGSPLN